MQTPSEFGFAPYPAPGAGGNRVLSGNMNLASGTTTVQGQIVREHNRWHSGTEPA